MGELNEMLIGELNKALESFLEGVVPLLDINKDDIIDEAYEQNLQPYQLLSICSFTNIYTSLKYDGDIDKLREDESFTELIDIVREMSENALENIVSDTGVSMEDLLSIVEEVPEDDDDMDFADMEDFVSEDEMETQLSEDDLEEFAEELDEEHLDGEADSEADGETSDFDSTDLGEGTSTANESGTKFEETSEPENEPGAVIQLSLDAGAKDRRRKPSREELESSEDKSESEKEKGKGKKKAKSKKEKKVEENHFSISDNLEIDAPELTMADPVVGTSSVLSVEGYGKVCERKDEDGLDLRYIAIEKLRIGKRIRVAIGDKKLENSIKVNGILEPLTVAKVKGKDEYVIVNGAKRYNCALGLGITKLPCVVGHTWRCKDLGYLEGITNMQTEWGGPEHLAFARKCLDDGIRNETMIESLCNMPEGVAHKAIDIFTDGDAKIVNPTATGKFYDNEVSRGYKKLEARRKKEREEGLEEGELIEEKVEEDVLADDDKEIVAYSVKLDEDDFTDSENVSKELAAEISKGKEIDGYSNHKQKVGEREYIDPAIRKATIAKCGNRCLCCGHGGESYVDCLDFHHVVPVYLGGEDSVENGTMLCILCHRQVHLYGCGDLHIDDALAKSYKELNEEERLLYPNEQQFKAEQLKMRNIVQLGNFIREGAQKQGLTRNNLKKSHPVGNLGRRRPGKNGVQTEA